MEDKKNMSMILAIVVCLLLVGALVFISLRGGEKNMDKENVVEKVAKTGDFVAMNYTGKLQDGTIFDSNVDPKFNHVEPFVFKLGAGQVIAGWDEGIAGMKVGEKKTLVIPPEKAYGPNDYGPIPGNSTLTFEVELLSIINN
jgi:FKBP-type peptidyl-prolyl cis-trans isomerase FkpA